MKMLVCCVFESPLIGPPLLRFGNINNAVIIRLSGWSMGPCVSDVGGVIQRMGGGLASGVN